MLGGIPNVSSNGLLFLGLIPRPSLKREIDSMKGDFATVELGRFSLSTYQPRFVQLQSDAQSGFLAGGSDDFGNERKLSDGFLLVRKLYLRYTESVSTLAQ